MSPELQAGNKNLYATDYVRWVDMTVQQLRAKNYAAVDWDNLIEEIEDMSRRERKSLKSNLIVILLHLLKWQYQPDRRSGSWRGSKNSFKLHDIPWRSCVSSIDPKGQSLRHITLFATLPKLRSGVLPQKKLETSNWTCLIKKTKPIVILEYLVGNDNPMLRGPSSAMEAPGLEVNNFNHSCVSRNTKMANYDGFSCYF